MNLTEEQSRAISSRGQVVVSASAGSGKTFVMIERLVSLILGGEHVRDMLAVTFTNKAAAQMRDRLRLALLKRIGESTGKERERLVNELNDLPVMDVSTIHAFCARLIRANFFLVDVDPAFCILSSDMPEGKTLSARAMDEVFEAAYEENSPEFSALLAAYFRKKKDARLRSVVLSLYESAREEGDPQSVLQSLGKGERFGEICAYLAEDFRSRAQYFADWLDDTGAWLAEHNARAFTVATDLMAALTPILNAKTLFEMTEYAKANPPAISMMPRMTKARGEELDKLRFLSGVNKMVKALYSELSEYAAQEEEEARYLDAERRTSALAHLALRYDEAYSRVKKENSVLDYQDLERYALQVLQNEEARGEMKARYKYVCVDEYQDVNPVQEKIISLVSGDDVFLVGDEKQAIYGFRGSRSEYFERKAEEAKTSLRLTSNFRSSSAVLEGVNRVFSALLGEKYAKMRGGDRYGAHRGAVKFHLVPEAEEEERAERSVYTVLSCEGAEKSDPLAVSIARVVEGEVGSVWFDADEGKEKRVTFGDIAVLVRNKAGEAERIAHELTLRGIPVSASAKVNVCDFFEARLLIDWLSFLDNAEQDIPLVTAMLSEAGGFDEQELAHIRLSEAGREYAFRAACRAYCEKFHDDLAEKLAAFFRRAEELRALAGTRSASEVAGLLLSLGLERQIAAGRDGEVRLARVRRLLREAEAAGSVHNFLARLAGSGYRVEYGGTGGEEAVHILTMHASKGLEYPVVILGGLDAAFHGADRDELLWTERFGAAPRSFNTENKTVYETVLRRAAEKVQEEEELVGERNLLYVAMTRAKDRLHLVFTGKEHAISPRFAKRFSDFIDFAACADFFTEEEELPPPLARAPVSVAADEREVKRIAAVYEKPYPFEASTRMPVKSSATELMHLKEDAEEHAHAEGKGHSVEEGLAYHAFLQHVRFGSDAEEELARMREAGELNEEQAALLDVQKLRAILAMPSLRGLYAKKLYREQKFLLLAPARDFIEGGTDDEVVLQGAIDLLVKEGDTFTVLDYKFSARSDEEIRKSYAVQISMYRRAVAETFSVDESRIKARILNIDLCREIQM